ncbi:PepSY domain-containing protein [Commensalibacter papalotli (ex Botero et al. 2024)]|uniref:PepSY-associated TM region (PiuB) (PUBMED:15124630) n=1 Tax=Commensalibacter papalotli (ex Botero et al. 2024) TaxID=2972766 RepID=A0ABN8W2R0_9PROT|nr:PepSY-associated TM helix domain-containing protein [Commensalibacter papalotli (ex Botero et al. 2024)]CAI3924524.1 PepSY-associated TM region (PiuB) (PUBMED:15124630) [Commensalibacter papalotli (ex Botero et al. 2024)]CAI3927541.1 PepSY-associated TM region (PiuB) (PUBMED:15124630) [Commensalibacter papalotli (ex Botero et al. 2024)]
MNKKTFSFFSICHQWIGLVGGWFLFIIFISGSISIFDKEITQWMQPELALYSPTKDVSTQALNQAYDSWKEYKDIRKNLIILPSARDPFIRVLHYQDELLQGVVIHPQEGNIIPARATGGGDFIDSLHRHLFIGRSIGGAIVLTIDIAFILILISGIVIYLPTLIKKLFFIYPKPKSLRFKSDLHTLIGIFFLPFLFVIAISGFLFLAPRYLPSTEPKPHISAQHLKKTNADTRPDLFPLLAKAQTYFGAMPSAIVFAKKEIRFMENDEARIARLKNYVAFDRNTMQQTSSSTPPTALSLLNKTLLGIHMVRAGDTILRIVFFLMGIGSSVLVAYGLLLFCNKKRNSVSSNTSMYKQYFYKTVEGINIGIIMGILIALVAFFWLNRLLPISLPQRLHWEITGFFSVFFIILITSILSTTYNKTYLTWISSIGFFSILCLFLPVLDIALCSSYLKAAIFNQHYLYIIMDSAIFFLGLIFLRLFFYIQSIGRK